MLLPITSSGNYLDHPDCDALLGEKRERKKKRKNNIILPFSARLFVSLTSTQG